MVRSRWRGWQVAGQEVHAKVLDATGHARKLVQFEREFTPGYQAAFGIMCETEGRTATWTPCCSDWRDEHLSQRYKEMNNQHPTPVRHAVHRDEDFLRETRLVERPA